MSDIFAVFNDDLDQSEAHVHGSAGRILDAADAQRFITAGKATVTLKSVKTGTRFTYRISKSEDGQVLFVGVLTGQDNESSYSYLGIIKPLQLVYWHGKKSKIGRDAPSNKAFDWAWRQIVKGRLPVELEVWHEGRCGRCNRKLTVPESIRTGFGPECAGRVGA